MQLSLISEKKKEKDVKEKTTRSVPKVVVSAKVIMQEKKEKDKADGKVEEKKKKWIKLEWFYWLFNLITKFYYNFNSRC